MTSSRTRAVGSGPLGPILRDIPFCPDHMLILALGLLAATQAAQAQLWNQCNAPVPPNNRWHTVAASADGSKMIAGGETFEPTACGPGTTPLFVSNDGGSTWMTNAGPVQVWQSVVCSADGAKLVAVPQLTPYDGSELIYTSPDGGVSWLVSSPTNALGWWGDDWTGIAASADGTRLVAVAGLFTSPDGGCTFSIGDGAIYFSTNSGASWTRSIAPTNQWVAVAASADGTKVVAAASLDSGGNGSLYVSGDAGATWTRTLAPANEWTCVACAADASALLAAATTLNGGDGLIYVSYDFGLTWEPSGAPRDDWATVTLSADASSWVAAATFGSSPTGTGDVYLSTNRGSTWTTTGAPAGVWAALACSADGYRVIAASSDGWLCTLPYTGSWTLTKAPAKFWNAVAGSADGTTLVAAADQLYISHDSGTNWEAAGTPMDLWAAVASSADGSNLVAAATWDCRGGSGLIYLSSDSGLTWAPASAPQSHWNGVACSADGKTILTSTLLNPWTGPSRVFVSTDAGATWTPTANNYYTNAIFFGAAISTDGSRAFVISSSWFPPCFGSGQNNCSIFGSSDSGNSWTQLNSRPTQWSCIACSADGSKVVAGATGFWNGYGDGSLHISSDSGATWSTTSAPENNWNCIATSSDGAQMLAVASASGPYLSGVYVSRDFGTNWTLADTPAGYWNAVTCSADGSHIVVVGESQICLHQSSPPPPPPSAPPRLVIALTGSNLSLSWLIPSTRFGLQQSSQLAPPSWVDITNEPALNFTNLQQQVTLHTPAGDSFYRLKRQ